MKSAFATGGLKGHWRRMLDRLLEREKSGFVTQADIALLYARLGDNVALRHRAIRRSASASSRVGSGHLKARPVIVRQPKE